MSNIRSWLWAHLRGKQRPLYQDILRAVQQLGDNAYGNTIRSQVGVIRGRAPSFGAIYPPLLRLEDKGMLRSWEGDPTPERGGRAKRFYALTEAGRAELGP